MKGGAPRASWRDRAPMILALSNLVRVGGPILTLLEVTFLAFLFTFGEAFEWDTITDLLGPKNSKCINK